MSNNNYARQKENVMWIEQGLEGWWRCYYRQPFTDQPQLMAEAFTPADAVSAGIDRWVRLYG
jgi:hypothetical protein